MRRINRWEVWLVAAALAGSGAAWAIKPVRVPNQETLRKSALVAEGIVLTLTTDRTARVEVRAVLKGSGVEEGSVIEVGPFPPAFKLAVGRRAVWLLGSSRSQGPYPVLVFGSYDVRLTRSLLNRLEEEEPVPASTRVYTLEELGVAWLAGGKSLTAASVKPDSPCGEAKLKTGDVVVKVEAASVSSPRAFLEAINAYGPGAVVKLRVQRSAAPLDLWLTLPD